jgi:hypothetical protein
MNLYRINMGHAAPKDWALSMLGYVLAENEEQVYEYLKSEPDIHGHKPFNSWKDKEEENEEFEIYNSSYEVIGKETFKEKIIRIGGEINEDDYDFSDSYYGISLYGWELVKENVSGLESAIELGIITQLK